MKTYFNLAEFGKRGQIRTLNARVARQELLLPGFGVYASPENLQRYTDIVIPEDAVQYSSTSVSEVRISVFKGQIREDVIFSSLLIIKINVNV